MRNRNPTNPMLRCLIKIPKGKSPSDAIPKLQAKGRNRDRNSKQDMQVPHHNRSLRLRRFRMLLHQPLEHALIAQHKLPQTLHHAQSLQPKVFNRLFDQVFVVSQSPIAVIRVPGKGIVMGLAGRVWSWRGCCNALAGVSRLPLTFEHVDNGVYRAERASTATSSRAVDEDWPTVGRIGAR